VAISVGKVAPLNTWPALLEATCHFGGAPRAATDWHLSKGSAASLGAEPAGDWRR